MLTQCKRLIKRSLVGSRILSLAQRLRGSRTILLRYHSIQPDPERFASTIGVGITHSAEVFRRQMEWVARHHEPVSLDDVADAAREGKPLPRRGVAITFDDGYADNFEVAVPILNRLGMSGAFYITTGCIEPHRLPWFCRLRHAFATTTQETWIDPSDQNRCLLTDPAQRRRAFLSASGQCARRAGAALEEWIGGIERALTVPPFEWGERLMMTWEQVRETHRQGHIVGAHTLTHPNLAQVSPEVASTEIGEAKVKLEEELGSEVRHFSYPSPILQPHWNQTTIEICRQHGYQTAVTCTSGAVLEGDERLCLKRISAPQSVEEFQWAVQCAFLGHYV